MNTKSKYTLLIAGCLAMILGGCESPKEWASIGGSKSDGIVTLGYQHRFKRIEKPVTSESQGLAKATSICKTWGYESAVAFDFEERTCIEPHGDGCVQYKVTKNYQCQ